MRLVHAGMLSIGVVFVAGGILFAATSAMTATEEQADIVKERRELMKQNGEDMKTIVGFVQAGAGTLDDVAAAAGQIAENARKIPDLFPAGTSMDDIMDPQTGAKPVIWEKWDEFVGHADTLEREALEMRDLAQAGDAAGVGEQLQVLGDEGCGGCHKVFRQKLN
jgi:cytochrome c556